MGATPPNIRLVSPHTCRSSTHSSYYLSPSPPTVIQVCEVCQAEFVSFDTLLLHRLCHFNTRHVCYVCDSYFSDTARLVDHVGQQHRELSRALGYYKNEVERPFSCRFFIIGHAPP